MTEPDHAPAANDDGPGYRLPPELLASMEEDRLRGERAQANIAALRALPPAAQMQVLRAAGLMPPPSPEWSRAESRRALRTLDQWCRIGPPRDAPTS